MTWTGTSWAGPSGPSGPRAHTVLCQFVNRFALRVAERVGDVDRTADGGHVRLGPVDAERLVDGRVDVADRDHPVGNVRTPLVAGADDVSPCDAAPADQERPAIGPVIAAELGVDVRSAAELAHHEDHRRLEQAADSRSASNTDSVWSRRGARSLRRVSSFLPCVSHWPCR